MTNIQCLNLKWTDHVNICTVSGMSKFKSASVDDYLKLLLDERCPVRLELSGMPIDFRPPLDWRVKLEGIPEHLFYFCLQGSMEAEVAGKVESMGAGDAVWIAPIQSFRLSSSDPRHTRLCRFRLQLSDASGRRVALKANYVRSVGAVAHAGWLEVLRQECVFSNGAADLGLRCALAGLLGGTFREKQEDNSTCADRRKLSVGQVRTLQKWVHELDRRSRPGTADLAARVQLSRDYFNRLCQNTFGLSAEHWLIRQRVEAAALRLIESDRTVGEVADEYGYSSLYFFSRQFRQVIGASPSNYRKRYHKRMLGFQASPQLPQ